MYKRKRDLEKEPENPYTFNGVALPAELGGKRDEGVPVYKQEVLDEQGRKRLHGAFTGGFSAGYFNTVGSKEGWAPSSFKSSRTNRAAAVQARPQDFMDDEDLDEGGEEEEMEISGAFTGKGPVEAVIRLGKKGEKDGSIPSTLDIREPEVFHDRETEPEPTLKPVVKKSIVRGGLGVGILNDNGEDEDIYEIKPKTAYDKVLGGGKKKNKKKVDAAFEASKVSFKKVLADHTFVSKKDAKAVRKVEEEAVRSPSPSLMAVDPPEASKEEAKPPSPPPVVEKKPERSVFDFMTPAARAKIAAVTGKADLPEALGEIGPEGYISNAKPEDLIPYLEKDIAMNALKGGFLPYADDPDKRIRYRTFLEVKAGVREGLPARRKGMMAEDWAKEMGEFAHAARIFKPITGMMANRFTSSASSTPVHSTKGWGTDDEVIITQPSAKKEDPAETAARMSMFGPMTRTISLFMPSRLLCKRFNVRAPAHSEPDDTEAAMKNNASHFGANFGQSGKKDLELVSKKDMSQMMEEVRFNQARSRKQEEREEEECRSVVRKEQVVESAGVKKMGKPGQEAIAAIFGDDSDEE